MPRTCGCEWLGQDLPLGYLPLLVRGSQVAELREALREALRRVYLRAGVLVDDPECRSDRKWGHVRYDETDIVNAAVNTPLAELSPDDPQQLAAVRSRAELGPCYIEPLRLDVKEPLDEEILGQLG